MAVSLEPSDYPDREWHAKLMRGLLFAMDDRLQDVTTIATCWLL
jgi:hypothetical protein